MTGHFCEGNALLKNAGITAQNCFSCFFSPLVRFLVRTDNALQIWCAAPFKKCRFSAGSRALSWHKNFAWRDSKKPTENFFHLRSMHKQEERSKCTLCIDSASPVTSRHIPFIRISAHRKVWGLLWGPYIQKAVYACSFPSIYAEFWA